MSEASIRFLYEVKDINKSIRQTQGLLRFVNNIRQTFNDVEDLMKNPTIGKAFWTAIQLIRTYNSLRRLLRLLRAASGKAALLGGLGEIRDVIVGGGPEVPTMPPLLGFAPMQMRVEAFRDNLPMGLEGLDLSMIPEQSREAVQMVLEEDAPITVEDARRILNSRIMYPPTTGTLEASIGWMPEAFGTRIYAGAYYGWWVEEGHDSFMGHHYMKDAADMARLRVPEKIRAELNNLINKGD